METTSIDHDIKVFYILAKSFPEGILDAHNTLHTMVPFSVERGYFGLSRPENGPIEYKAAAEELIAGEAETLKCPTLIIQKGQYISLTVENYTTDIQSISNAFQQLLEYPGLDPQGYCVEWYLNDKDVKCMIRLGA